MPLRSRRHFCFVPGYGFLLGFSCTVYSERSEGHSYLVNGHFFETPWLKYFFTKNFRLLRLAFNKHLFHPPYRQASQWRIPKCLKKISSSAGSSSLLGHRLKCIGLISSQSRSNLKAKCYRNWWIEFLKVQGCDATKVDQGTNAGNIITLVNIQL